MTTHNWGTFCAALVLATTLIAAPGPVLGKAGEKPPQGTSYAPVDLKEDVAAVIARMKAAKPEIMKRHLNNRRNTGGGM